MVSLLGNRVKFAEYPAVLFRIESMDGSRKVLDRWAQNHFLTKSEEEKIVRWLIDLAKCGFPRKKEELLDSVQKIVLDSKRRTPFKNDRPGEKWYKLFLNRHPEIALREPERVTKGRS